MIRQIFLFVFLFQALFGDRAHVGFGKSGGRFGDNLLSYLHAKWLSLQNQIPVLYEPFPYSSELVLDEKEDRGSPNLRPFPYRMGMRLDPNLPFVYICPFFPAFEEEQREGGWPSFPVDWKNLEFRKASLEMIAPKKKMQLSLPPPGMIGVAVHVREGGGYDTDHTRLYDPLKLPPLHFYIEAIRKIAEIFPQREIYCRIFTDAINPSLIAETIKKAAPPQVHVDFRAEGNHHTKNVLEDFFSLFEYNVLIRPRSNFSVIPSLLRDYAIVCYPADFVRTGTQIKITRIGIEKNDALCDSLNRRAYSDTPLTER